MTSLTAVWLAGACLPSGAALLDSDWPVKADAHLGALSF